MTGIKSATSKAIEAFLSLYVVVDECAAKPCKNGASCKITADGYSCQPCPAGWQGKDCDQGWLYTERNDQFSIAYSHIQIFVAVELE